MNDDTKPSLAAGMAKRSFWIAVAAGWLGFLCRVEAVGQAAQALLMLVATALLLIAAVFGAVALIRITSADRNAVLVPGLAGVLLSLALLANLSYWGRDQWVQARIKSQQQAQDPQPGPPRQRAEPAPPKSTVQYSLPALEGIPQALAEVRAGAARSSGDDRAVLRAWAAHLEKLHTAYTNTHAASNKLHAVDLLDPKSISNFDQDEPVRRRGLANQYADAWRLLGDSLSTFAGSYYSDLRDERVSSERSTVEGRSLSAFVEQPETAARLAALRKLCAAEQAVGHHYNYAVSAVFNYALLASKVPTPSPGFRNDMDRKVSKLKEIEQAAADARREAFSPAARDSSQGEARADARPNP
jgi:hypothetical protein